MMNYDGLDLEDIISYINTELLKGRSMRDIEENDFGVNDRVIVKRLARKNVKRVDGQFVLQIGSKMTVKSEIRPISLIERNINKEASINLSKNTEFLQLKNKVDFLEQALKEIICVQNGSNMVANDLGLKIYSSDDKPVPKTIRLYKEVWDKLDRIKEIFPHINYQTLLNSLIDEVADKYLKNQ